MVANVDQLGGMFHALGPGHLADVHQAFDTLLKFHEGTVVGDADDASAYVRAHWIAMLGIQPRVGCELLEAQRHALFVFVELQHLDLNLIAHIDQVTRMGQAVPRTYR